MLTNFTQGVVSSGGGGGGGVIYTPPPPPPPQKKKKLNPQKRTQIRVNRTVIPKPRFWQDLSFPTNSPNEIPDKH